MADKILVDTKSFINTKRSLIYGTLLGDSSISGIGKHARMKILHSEDQKEYAKHKYDLFSEVAQGELKTRKSWNPRGKPEWWFCTTPNLEWRTLWELFHSNTPTRKTVTENILNSLDDHGLALWIMDDGSYSYMRHKERPGYLQYRFHLCTEGYTKSENELIRSWFENRYNVHFVIEIQKRKLMSGVINTYYRLRLGMIEYESQIVPRIKPYVIPSMEYKIKRTLPK